MKRGVLPVTLLCLGCAQVVFSQAPVPLPCGQMVTGSLDTGNNRVVYTITVPPGNAPETIYLRADIRGSAVSAQLSILDTNNSQLRPISLPPGSPNLQMFNLLTPGNYQVSLTAGGSSTYQLAYIPTNQPCSNPALTCAAAVKGALAPGQMQSYQFKGSKGDPVSVLFVRTGGDPGNSIAFIPFDSSGLPQNFQSSPYILPSDGLQTFVLVETSGTLKQNYALSLVDLKGPCATTAISCGSVIDASISDVLGVGLYTINASANDIYTLGLVPTDSSGGLQVSVQVYDSQGNTVQPSNISGVQLRYPPLAAGSYLVLVQDASGQGTGKYTLSLARLNNGPCGSSQPISCGTTASGQINGALRFNSYLLNAQANDVYLLRLLKTNTGGFTPSVEVYGPDGLRVANVNTGTLGSTSFTTSAAGAYTVIVSDLGATGSGSYAAWLGRLNRPCDNPSPLQCGTLASGAITKALDAGLYTYTGDAFTVRMIDTGGTLQSSLQVYAPNTTGQPLPLVSGNTKAVDVAGPQGTYTILVTDLSNNPQTGTFSLAAISTKGSCSATPPAGQSVSGLASGPAPFTAYTFPASRGDPMLLRLASFTPGFTANMDLYDPNGKRLGSSTFRLASAATVAGNYTAVVGASAPRSAGSYAFAWQLLDQPVATVLGCGQTNSGALGTSSQFSYYVLSANDGDILKLVLTRLPSNLNAQVELFDANGATVKSSTTEINQKLRAGGYTILVSPATAAAETGAFALAMERPNNPCSPLNLTCGQTILQQVTVPGQMDAYVFNGNVGDQAAITVSPRLGAISPVTELYDPSGNAVLSAPASTSLNTTLTSTGPYMVTVHDKTGSNTGSYRIGLQHSNTPCPEDDTQKPSITLLRPTGGEVIAGGTLFPIAWQSDDNTAVTTHLIQLSTDGGKTFGPLPGGPTNTLNGLAQSFSWTVPSGVTPTRTAVVRVTATDKGGNSQSASSDMLTLIGSGFTANENVKYAYDPLNRIVQVSYSDGRIIFYNYDAGGNLINIQVQ